MRLALVFSALPLALPTCCFAAGLIEPPCIFRRIAVSRPKAVILYLYREVPSIGLVWFLILPAIVGSFGRRLDVFIWTPLSVVGLVFAYGHVDGEPAFSHPLSIPNLLGALFFMALIIVRFLSDRARREEQLREAVEQTQAELERRKLAERKALAAQEQTTRFLASMSHELRTPMTSMLLSSELLRSANTMSPLDARRAAERIHNSAQVVLNLVNDVLDLAKIDAGKTRIDLRTFPLEPMLEDVRLLLQPAAAASGTRLYVLFGPDLPAQWRSDPACVRQILINLVSNAIKHTAQGAVVLTARVVDGRLLFEVTDTGIGMSDTQAERIFDPFVQLAQATQQGTGLGLTLCREYAKLVGGTLRLQHSEPGEGSRFQLQLPESKGVEPALQTIGEAYVSDRLAGLSYRIEAMRPEAKAWAEDWLQHWGARLTPLGTPCDLERSVDAAVGNVAELARLLGALTGNGLGEEQVAASGGVRGRCLVCDDNDMIRDVLCSVLEALDYAAEAVATGAEALTRLDDGDIDMMFLDVQLHGESGIDVLRTLRAQGGRKRHLPVCMISGSLLGREDALAAGANDYLLKPPRMREVAEVTASLVSAAWG